MSTTAFIGVIAVLIGIGLIIVGGRTKTTATVVETCVTQDRTIEVQQRIICAMHNHLHLLKAIGYDNPYPFGCEPKQ